MIWRIKLTSVNQGSVTTSSRLERFTGSTVNILDIKLCVCVCVCVRESGGEGEGEREREGEREGGRERGGERESYFNHITHWNIEEKTIPSTKLTFYMTLIHEMVHHIDHP